MATHFNEFPNLEFFNYRTIVPIS